MYEISSRPLSYVWFFNILIFATLVFLKRPYVEISCTNFHPDRPTNVESAERNTLSPLSIRRLQLTQFH